MKRFFVALFLIMLAPIVLSAQEQEWVEVKSGDDGDRSNGPYLTNQWFDNWYIGVAGGVNSAFSALSDPKLTPEVEINVLKWFTPCVGARLGYQGLRQKEILEYYNPAQLNHSAFPYDGDYCGPGTMSYGFMYVHGDLLWNISNTFGGYRYGRIYNLSIYANAGYVRLYDHNDGIASSSYDNELGLGAGLYNTFRIAGRLNLTIDIRHTNIASRYKTTEGIRTNFLSASAGLAYNIKRTYWNSLKKSSVSRSDVDAIRVALAESERRVEALTDSLDLKDKALAEVRSELNEMEAHQMADDQLRNRLANADIVLYYAIDSPVLGFSERQHLRSYVEDVLSKDPQHVFFITGSADKGTGTYQHNVELSQGRAAGVKRIMTQEFGIPESNVVIKDALVSSKNTDGALDRCVLIESN